MPSGVYSILSWVLVIAVFYIFLILPERKKQKNMKNMLDGLKIGDKVLTRGGIYGKIQSINEDSVVITTGPDEVKLEMTKLSIGTVIEREEEKEEENKVEYKNV